MAKVPKDKKLIKEISGHVGKLENILQRHPEGILIIEKIKSALKELDETIDFNRGTGAVVRPRYR